MYKNQLQELAQRSCFNLPSYTCVREGPDHAPRFKASVKFNGEVFWSPNYCSTLRQAEHSAAEVALCSLSTGGPSHSIAARILDETGVYKNLLQEIAQRVGAPLPLYATFRSGLGHLPVFTGIVELAGISFTGEPAKNKKQAEKNAAMSAWSSLKQLAKEAASSSFEPEYNDELEQITIARALLNYRLKEKIAANSSSIPFTKKFPMQNPRPTSPQQHHVATSKILPLICQKATPRNRSASLTTYVSDLPLHRPHYGHEGHFTRPQKFAAAGAAPYVPNRQFRAPCHSMAPPVTISTKKPLCLRFTLAILLLHKSEGEKERALCFAEIQIGSEKKRFAAHRSAILHRRAELEPIQETHSLKAPAAAGNGQIRYRTPSSAELLEGSTSPTHPSDLHDAASEKMMKRAGRQPESLSDRIYRYRSVVLVICVPLLLVTFVLFLMPSGSPSTSVQDYNRKFSPGGGGDAVSRLRSKASYAVIFDAGSSGSRVHVFCFDGKLDLVPIGNDLELFEQIKPGLSAYAKDPQEAAQSLLTLLDKAESVVPQKLRSQTPVRVGATAGLRALEGDASDRILQAVRDILKARSKLRSEMDAVTVLDGTQEGSYQWVTINYLLGNLGKDYSETVGVVDLGGGSVQMAYAISEADAAKAPRITDGENTYVKEMYLMGKKYYLYVHSYLHYGLLAARAEILNVPEDSGNPCVMVGYQGSYKYGGKSYEASASPSGSNMNGCRRVALNALKVNESTCTHMKCTFGGVWNGGGGDGQKNLFVASFFFDRAAEAGFVDPKEPVAKVRPADFEDAAKRACQTKIEDAKTTYPNVEEGNLPYLCMDLVYQYTLLVDGFGLDPWQEITLVKKVKYRDALVEAAWPLGSAIEAVSLPT